LSENKGGHMPETLEKTETNTNPFDEDVETEISQLETEINILDSVSDVKEVTLTHPVTGEQKTFTQKELAFIPKTRLLSLVATTIRAASESENSNVGDLLSDMFGGVNSLVSQGVDLEDAENYATNQFLEIILRLVEVAPDFLDQLYLLILNVKPKDRQWVVDALEVIDDEQGVEILDTAIAQNGDALRDFFNTHLRRVANRAQTIWATAEGEDTAQE
jgi:hypothetical protein